MLSAVSRAARAISAGKRGDRRSRLRAVIGGAAQGGYGRYKGERVKDIGSSPGVAVNVLIVGDYFDAFYLLVGQVV